MVTVLDTMVCVRDTEMNKKSASLKSSQPNEQEWIHKIGSRGREKEEKDRCQTTERMPIEYSSYNKPHPLVI